MGNIIIKKIDSTYEIINKLQRDEKVNSQMFDILHRDESNKFLIPNYNRLNRSLKVSVSLCRSIGEVLTNPIDKDLFFKIINQSIMIIELCQRKKLNIDNLDLYLQNVYISMDTFDCYFIYWPMTMTFVFDNSYDYFYQIGKQVRIKADKHMKDQYLQYFHKTSELVLDEFKKFIRHLEYGRLETAYEETVLCIDDKQETTVLKPYSLDDEETTILGTFETTLVGSSELNRRVFPKMIRESTNQEYMIQSDEYTIGTDSGCDCCIHDSRVISRRHAKIIFHDHSYFIFDCHSTNGTYVDDILIDPKVEVELYSGSMITLANEKFMFTYE